MVKGEALVASRGGSLGAAGIEVCLMKQQLSDLKIYRKIEEKQSIKVVAFGSSSTQRFMCGMHWFDYVDLGFKNYHSHTVGQFINSGVSNDSTVQLLERFDNECAVYRPDLVLIMAGANDCRLEHSLKQFHTSMRLLHDKVKALDADIILQTFYPIDMERSQGWWLKVEEYSLVLRQLSEETGCLLVDTEKRWKALREHNPETYRTLMRDCGHLNEFGNMVLGLDLARFLNVGLLLRDGQIDYCKEGIIMQYKIDELNRGK